MTYKAPTYSSAGFTLVELAISLMVIGLLLAGILKGQELIENARITTLVRQVQSYETGSRMFQSTYGALPGDIGRPGTRIPNCTTAPCTDTGNEDGYITYGGIGAVATGENRNFWLHMAVTKIITGIDTSGRTSSPFQWNIELPESNFVGRGFSITALNMAVDGIYPNVMANVLVLVSPPASYFTTPALTTERAMLVDRKMDDGKPLTGTVWGRENHAGACRNGNEYALPGGTSWPGCNMIFVLGS